MIARSTPGVVAAPTLTARGSRRRRPRRRPTRSPRHRPRRRPEVDERAAAGAAAIGRTGPRTDRRGRAAHRSDRSPVLPALPLAPFTGQIRVRSGHVQDCAAGCPCPRRQGNERARARARRAGRSTCDRRAARASPWRRFDAVSGPGRGGRARRRGRRRGCAVDGAPRRRARPHIGESSELGRRSPRTCAAPARAGRRPSQRTDRRHRTRRGSGRPRRQARSPRRRHRAESGDRAVASAQEPLDVDLDVLAHEPHRVVVGGDVVVGRHRLGRVEHAADRAQQHRQPAGRPVGLVGPQHVGHLLADDRRPRRATSSLTRSRALRDPHSPTSTGCPARVTRNPPSVTMVTPTASSRRPRLGPRPGPRGAGVGEQSLGRLDGAIAAPAPSSVSADDEDGPRLADAVAEVVAERRDSSARRRSAGSLSARLQQQRLGDRRRGPGGPARAAPHGPADGRRRIAPAQLDPPGGQSACGADVARSPRSPARRPPSRRGSSVASVVASPIRAVTRPCVSRWLLAIRSPGGRGRSPRCAGRAAAGPRRARRARSGRGPIRAGSRWPGPAEVVEGVVESAKARRVAAVA